MLSKNQLIKLSKGGQVQINSDMIPYVFKTLQLTPENKKKLLKSLKNNKGCRLSLDITEIEGSGLKKDIKKAFRKINKVKKKGEKIANKAIKYGTKAYEVGKKIDDDFEKYTGSKLSDRAKDYVTLNLDDENKKKLNKTYNKAKKSYDIGKRVYDDYGGINELNRNYNKLENYIEKLEDDDEHGAGIGRQLKKAFRKKNVNKGLKQINRGVKKGLKEINNITDKLGIENLVDQGVNIAVDEIMGRVATPFVGATLSNMAGDQIKNQTSRALHKSGYNIVNPYIPKYTTSGGSFRPQGGSFRTYSGTTRGYGITPGFSDVYRKNDIFI